MSGIDPAVMDAAVEAAAKVLSDEGGKPDIGLHSWRCGYPERYGPCDCLAVTARLILEAAAPILTASPDDRPFEVGDVVLAKGTVEAGECSWVIESDVQRTAPCPECAAAQRTAEYSLEQLDGIHDACGDDDE